MHYGNPYYPIEHWLLFSYVRAWIAVLAFCLACLSAGWTLLKIILPISPRLSERLLLAFAAGAVAFYLVLFVAGMLGLFSAALFFALPLALFALGVPQLAQDWPRLRPRLRSSLEYLLQPRSMLQAVAAVLCVIALLAIYMQVILPRNTHADSFWYHMPIAEHYVAAGGIVRFEEGWYVGCYPQLASLLYTWAFLSPGELFAHVVLCEHLDFVLFVATVFGVSGLAARLLQTRHFPYAGACVFLFPKLFIYDSNVSANAEHVLGFWIVVLGIALVRLSAQFNAREAVLAGLFAGAAASTKYQACYVIVPAILLVAYLALRRRMWVPGMVWLSTVGVVTATHWLKNLVYYHDPFYPLLYRYLPLTPFHPGAGASLERAYWLPQFVASGPLPDRLLAALKTSLTFSFVPNDWDFHGQRPVFGSLFTLAIPVLILAVRKKRVWGIFVGTHIALVVWYLTSHQDRFLQALLPWMAAATAAVLRLVWEKGASARLGAGVLVLAQMASGLDVYFIRNHLMLAESPIRAVAEYLAAGHKGHYKERYVVSPAEEKVGAVLPQDAVVLSHMYHSKLGIGAKMVADGVGWQGAIEYLLHDSPARTAELCESLGVTHVMRHGDPPGLSPEDAAREAVFHRWLALYTGAERILDDIRLVSVLSRPRDELLARQPTIIAWIDCNSVAMSGLYTPQGLSARAPLKALSLDTLQQNPLSELAEATAVVRNGSCGLASELEITLATQFVRRVNAGPTSILVRTRATALAPR